jgi:EAL domain-containing protein (putative c-di-GMP-specific phosphodiesterase class I)
MLVYNVTVEQARTVGQRISGAIKRHIFPWKGREFHLGVSIGVAMVNPENLTDADDVLNRADQACYAAKELSEALGRVYVHHRDRDVSEQQSEALALASEVRSAVDSDTLQLHRQPILPLEGGGVERALLYQVLLRMQSQGGKVVAPEGYIPSSERSELMPALDRWAVEQAFSKIAAQEARGEFAVHMIPLSGLSLVGEGIELFIRDQLVESGVAAEHLVFQLEETVAYKQMTMVQQFIEEMHRLGLRVALDDYGGVASSFTSLQKLPVDMIKINRQLICGVIHNPVEYTVVESMTRVGAVLGMECVAVGVENRETVEALGRIGVNYLQGPEVGGPQLWS